MNYSKSINLSTILVVTCLILGLLLGCSKETPTNSTDDVQSGLIGPGDGTSTKIRGMVSAVNGEKEIIWLQFSLMKVISTDKTTIQKVSESEEAIAISIADISINDLIIATGHYAHEVIHENNAYKVSNATGSQNVSSFVALEIAVYQATSDTCNTCGYWSLCDSIGGFADSCWTQYPSDTCWVPCDSTNPLDTCRIYFPCDSGGPPGDTCCLGIPKYQISIETTLNAPLGSNQEVSIFFENTTEPGSPIGGFDLLIQYDPTVLSFNTADPGELINTCDWEYFDYRHGDAGNCGANACPTDKIRLVAVADLNDGANHPTCYGQTPTVLRELALLQFLVTNDSTLECEFSPIQFSWYDCGDNAISSKLGDALYISRNVYNFGNPNNIAGDFTFPTLNGANSNCDQLEGEFNPLRYIDFINGGIGIVCPSDS